MVSLNSTNTQNKVYVLWQYNGKLTFITINEIFEKFRTYKFLGIYIDCKYNYINVYIYYLNYLNN